MNFIDNDLDGIDLDPSDFSSSVPLKKVPNGDVFEASRAGDVDRLRYLLESGVNVNARDHWDSVALYYACLAGHLDAARMLLENGAICSEHTFDGDRCHYAALNLKVRHNTPYVRLFQCTRVEGRGSKFQGSDSGLRLQSPFVAFKSYPCTEIGASNILEVSFSRGKKIRISDNSCLIIAL
ncbi:putative ankyrin repeat-containing domain-containing protein [Lupinus albus]|uniref:Putative ankyrin repeat-containing domain-containing protein n=1 Tax=Lupinus albus TaxID=3870 RepID=A0A6A4MSL7_LUPAL|nr:putative ankyrin repeat-containing domain-containing protein [Lupinus albus]